MWLCVCWLGVCVCVQVDGKLVLETGQVVEDPMSHMTEEQKEERRMLKVRCGVQRQGTRWEGGG